ncbi:MAG: hypothetical protein ACK559_26940, partial [bacterium]
MAIHPIACSHASCASSSFAASAMVATAVRVFRASLALSTDLRTSGTSTFNRSFRMSGLTSAPGAMSM